MPISPLSPATVVQRKAQAALEKMQNCPSDTDAIKVGDTYLKDISRVADDQGSRIVAQAVAQVSETLRTAPSLAESCRVVQEVGLRTLAAGVSGPIGKTLARLGLETRTEIQTTTFWGKSGDTAGQDRVVGWYLRAIENESPNKDEKALVGTVFAFQRDKARCFDSVAFDSKALELIQDGKVDLDSTAALLKNADKEFFQWPGGGD